MQNQKHNNPTVTSQNIAAWNASRDKDGKTGLMQIAASGNLELATALIKGGANLLAKDNTGNTVIQWAEKSKNPEMVKLIKDSLIEKIAKWNASIDKDGRTGLMQIAASGNLELASALIEGGANLLAKDNKGNTVIQWAEKSKNPEMVKLIEDSLIAKYGVEPRDPKDHFTAGLYVNYKQGELAIISNFYGTVNLQATYPKQEALQKLYIELKQKDKVENTPWNYMLTALRIQNTKSNKNNADTLEYMMEKEIYGLQASIAKTENEKPALTKSRGLMLMLAAMNGHDAVVTYLLKNGADPHHKLNGITPLMLAIIHKHDTIAENLITEDNLEQGKDGFTLFMLAVKYGTPDIIEAIIKKIKEPNNYLALKNKDGYSALMLAVMANRAAVAKMLIDKGANPQDMAEKPVAKMLIDRGAAPQDRAEKPETLLMLAARQGSHDMINLILGHDIDMNAVNLQRETALKIAHKANNKEGIAALLKHAYKLHFTGSPIRYWPQIFIQKYFSNTSIKLHPEGKEVAAELVNSPEKPLANLPETGTKHDKNVRPEGPTFP